MPTKRKGPLTATYKSGNKRGPQIINVTATFQIVVTDEDTEFTSQGLLKEQAKSIADAIENDYAENWDGVRATNFDITLKEKE